MDALRGCLRAVGVAQCGGDERLRAEERGVERTRVHA